MKKGLGRGLGALLDRDGETAAEDARKRPSADGAVFIDIRMIEPNRNQPRQYFDEESLGELAESIKSYGVIQPLIVKDCGGYYSIIAGERRFRAARSARLDKLPVIVKDYTELETLQIALIENIQRQDLTPIEEAVCYKRLMDDFFFSQEDIASKIGKNRFTVSNTVRLLELDARVQVFVAEGKLTASHARLLLSVKDMEAQYACACAILEKGLSVRGAEEMITAALAAQTAALKAEADDKAGADADKPGNLNAADMKEAVLQAYRHTENELKALFGARVNIRGQGRNKGKIEIEYYSKDELDRLLCMFKSINTAL